MTPSHGGCDVSFLVQSDPDRQVLMRISVITPTLNQCQFLGHTAGSILQQTGSFELEWIVIDGGSIDGTLALLQSLEDPRIRWTSQNDSGQAHAINKGLSQASGDIVSWLNSDDLYVPGALAAVTEAFERHPTAQWLIGRCQIIDANGGVIRSSIARYKDAGLNRYSYRGLLRENFISQPAVFWRRQFASEIGPLDESLHWTMDYDLWLRMAARAQPLILDQALAQFRLHPKSKSGGVDRRQFDEQYRVACRYLGGDWISRAVHRFNVEKIVWAYRLLRLLRK